MSGIPTTTRSRLHVVALHCLALTALFLSGCASKGRPEPIAAPVIFPAPPAEARVQHIGSVSSTADLPRSRGGFAEFVLGPAPVSHLLAKPISARLRGDRLYVADTVFNTVVVYDLRTGEAHRLRGDRGIGKISQPNNLAFDEAGRLYVADAVRQAVLVYNPDESFHAAWGRPGEIRPVDVAAENGELFVCSAANHQIEVWSAEDGEHLRTFGGLGSDPGEFFIPTHIDLDGNGHLFITDTGNFRVQKVTLDGEPVDTVGGPGRTFGSFAWPKGLSVDSHGRLYVADSRFANIQMFDSEGRLLLYFGAPGPDGGNLNLPAGVHVMDWPAGLPWLEERLLPGFEPAHLLIVVNQEGGNFVNLFAIARDED